MRSRSGYPKLALAIVLGAAQNASAQSAGEIACDPSALLRPGRCDGDAVDAEEQTLLARVNAYRAEHDLPPVALSPALSIVANRHVRDLANHAMPSLHDWSDCTYRGGSNDCMWRAPARLATGYPGFGYEVATAIRSTDPRVVMTAAQALQSWQGSAPHNAVLLSTGTWSNAPWRAVGVAIYGSFAVLWFGHEEDPTAAPSRPPTTPMLTPTPTPSGAFEPVNPAVNLLQSPLGLATEPPLEQGPGDGLRALYFADPALRTLVAQRIEPALRFDWGLGAPLPSVPVDRFSVRFVGYLSPREAGPHRIVARADGGLRVYVGEALLLDRWASDARNDPSIDLWLEPGDAVSLRVEYSARDGASLCELRMQAPSGAVTALSRATLSSAHPRAAGYRFGSDQ